MRALIVEDEFVSRQLMTNVLGKYFELNIVVNGKEAVDAVRFSLGEAQPYALILMDIMMPEMDGITALKKIRDIEREHGVTPAKAIMTTALSDPRTVIRAFNDGLASGFVVKPIDLGELMDKIEELGLLG